ncbi:Ada metal-binding domain-containing protein [Thalassotalea psychrophila]|uniref:Ada metal-binding domain-containing protein n=1 Tax=Thalassotalea psychrophila TaxID=3065647 RepID=A0ABY9TVG8_9GAMM|nr:Ada metal-binding domain-containing protein [Colwelliaceae bacterium SQ149]
MYKLLDEKGALYINQNKGIFGGHSKLKIYGKLDCPSALGHISKGHYVKYRVFFKDENTAILAGYRPCARCMKKEYLHWKSHC